jgi:hypothetical protein
MAKKNMEAQQLELFGGLKDQGNKIDPISKNKVPVGSTKKEVRDDIPAQLSEGEFVLPADVVRYHGLEKIMGLRDQAKSGLGKMEAMGQMGNPEEATLPDTTPFNPRPMAQGGFNQPTPFGVNIAQPQNVLTKQSQYTPPNIGINPPPPVVQPIPMPVQPQPVPQQPVPQQQPAPTYQDLMGTPFGQLPKSEVKTYKNKETGQILNIPFVDGNPVYSIPEGFVLLSEADDSMPKASEESSVGTIKPKEDKDDRDQQPLPPAGGQGESFDFGKVGDFLKENALGIAGSVVGGPFLGFLGRQVDKKRKGKSTESGLTMADDETFGLGQPKIDVLGDVAVSGKVGRNIGDTEVVTRGVFNNQGFAINVNPKDKAKYGGPARNAQGHTVYRTITDQVKAAKSAIDSGWFGGPLSPMEYFGLTSEQKDNYDKFSTSLGLIDQNYRTEGKNSKAYQRFLDSITTNDNIGGSGKAPANEGDGYLVSNGKAYKGKYVRNQTTGNMQFEREGGGTIVAVTGPDGTAKVGDLTGSGLKTQPLVKKEDEMAGVAEAQAAEERRKEEAEKTRKATEEARQAKLEKDAKAAVEARAKQRQEEIEAEKQRQREQRESERDARIERDRQQRAGSGTGTGRRGGQGIVRAKGGLASKPKKLNMKRGGLASIQ